MITSIDQLLTTVRKDLRRWKTATFPWFRGEQTRTSTPLLPALFREHHSENRQPIPVVFPTTNHRSPLINSQKSESNFFPPLLAFSIAEAAEDTPQSDSKSIRTLARQAENALKNGDFEEYIQFARQISLRNGIPPGAVLQGKSPLALGVRHSYLVAAKDAQIKAMGFGPIVSMRIAALKMPVPGMVRQEIPIPSESRFRVLTTDLAKVSVVWENMDKIEMPIYDLANPTQNCYGWTNKVLTRSGLPPIDPRDVW